MMTKNRLKWFVKIVNESISWPSVQISSPAGTIVLKHKQEAAGQGLGSCWTAIAVSWLSNKTRKRRERLGISQAL